MNLSTPTLAFAIFGTCACADSSFVCTTLDVGQVVEDGSISDTGFTKLVEDSRPTFTFDSRTGTYVSGSIRWEFDVLQTGNAENSLKAIRVVKGPASVVVQYLSIETFQTNNFLFVWNTEVWSGTCEIV